MQMGDWKHFFIQMWMDTVNPIIEKMNQNIKESIENYKKLGEQVQSQEIQKIREILNDTAQIIEQFLQTFDLKLAEFLIEAQKNLEVFFEQIQLFFKSENLKSIQEKWEEFTKSLLNQTPESILNQIFNNFTKKNSSSNQTNQDDLSEEINLIFSESDTNLLKKDQQK